MALKYPNRGIRHALAGIVPNWLSNRPPFNTGFKILYAIALVFDVLVEMMLQGVYAAMPGKGTPTALGFIGQGRGILQGLAETNVDYAKRLRNWLTFWYNAGSGEVLAQMIQSFLPNSPRVTVIDRSGNFVIANQNGTTAFQRDATWNWDGISNPERMGWWSDIWVIVWPDPWATWEIGGGGGATGWTNTAAKAQWHTGGPQGMGIGHQVPRVAVDGIYQIVSTWKGAHTFLVAIVFTTVQGLFSPGTLGTGGNPDGTWGRWGKFDGTKWVPSRTRELTVAGTYVGHCRYWTPGNGG